jgi:hypothetical protein
MPPYSTVEVNRFFSVSDNATTAFEKGRALEDLTCYLFELIPGIKVSKRDQMNVAHTEEIDIAFWNDRLPEGLAFLPYIIIVECKNHTRAVDTRDVSYFITKIRNRGFDFGILVATNGITGSSQELNDAHSQISSALKDKIHIIVMTRDEIERLANSEDLIGLIKEKLCELAVCGSIFLKNNT